MKNLLRSWLLIISSIVGLYLSGIGAALAQDTTPVKIEIQPLQKVTPVGQAAPFRIALTNARGAPAMAPKAMTVRVLSRSPSGQLTTTDVTIGAGESAATGSLTLREAGASTLQTDNPALLGGGGLLFGVAPAAPPAPAPPISRAPASGAPLRPSTRGVEFGSVAGVRPAAPGAAGTVAALPEPGVPAGAPDGAAPALVFTVEPKKLLADGVDSAKVDVYLDPFQRAPQDIRIRFEVTRGTLENNELVLRKGEYAASTQWKSARDSSGIGAISIAGSDPRLPHGDKQEHMFYPPISDLRLSMSPPDLTLMNRGNVLATLWDDVNGVAVATDADITLTLNLVQGSGQIRPLDVVFRKGQSTARADFQPYGWGPAAVAAQIPNIFPREVKFNVGIGLWTLMFSVAGGLAGGLLAWLSSRRKWWRILIGGLTGFVLFGAVLLFGPQKIVGTVAEMDLLNPISVFIFSVIGGWLGTASMALILRRLGIHA